MTALTLSTPKELASASWGLLPPLGDLEAYISAVQRMPMLSSEEELKLARELRETGDLEAAGRLVMSHLRLVVSVSRQYLGYGLQHGDLIQEGNVGLMKAVRRFDPDHGVRLVSYALHWIKAEIHEYILRNWRMVKVATTKAQRKLFFNLRSLKHGFQAEDQGAERATLNSNEVEEIAQALNVKVEDVREMETRMMGGDVVLDPVALDDEGESYGPIAYLADPNIEPTEMIEAQQREALASNGIAHALAQLDERSRHIVSERWLNVNDDGSGGKTLHELAAIYGVSAERVRQIEAAAMKKMKQSLELAECQRP